MLTPEEQAELNALEQEEAQAQEILAQKSQIGGLTPEEQQELAQLEAEEQQAQKMMAQQPQLDMSEEADLGALTRARYSLEPLQSNREALLVEQFGKENVFKDPSGELFLKQRGKFIPVNAPGLSMGDVGEMLGAAPEALGAGAGALLGMGAGSIPGAMVGGAAGSALRQALSAATGAPQVAQLGERAVETGLSGLFAGGGTLLGKGLKGVGRKALDKITDLFPEYTVSKEGKKIAEIAAKEGIPEPTVGQMAGGRTLETEKLLAEKPLFGRNIRKQTEKQVEAIKKNVSEVVGEFMDTESKAFDAGTHVKETAGNIIEGIKKEAGSLFDEVAEEGAKVSLPAKNVHDELLSNFRQFGLFSRKGSKIPYSPKSGLTKDQFSRLQNIFGDVLGSIEPKAVPGQIGEQTVTANDLNVLRKTIDSYIREGQKAGYDDVVLTKMRKEFMDVTENMLEQQSPEVAAKFKNARGLWSKKIELEKLYTKGGQGSLEQMTPEKVAQKYMKDSKSADELIQLVGKENAKEIGKTYLNDIFQQKLGAEGQIGARAAIRILRDRKQALIKTIGKKDYNRLRKNLFVLDKVGAPVNPSRTNITRLMTDISPSALLEGMGLQGFRMGRKVVKPMKKAAQKALEGTPKTAGQLGNVLGSDIQREGAQGARRGR